MTQRDLATSIGVHYSLVSRVERGERWPSDNVLDMLAFCCPGEEAWKALMDGMIEAWCAYSPGRKGKRP